jgi:hypothetical protein
MPIHNRGETVLAACFRLVSAQRERTIRRVFRGGPLCALLETGSADM